MKKLKLIFTFLIILYLSVTLVACSNTSNSGIMFSLTRDKNTNELGKSENIFKLDDNNYTFYYSTPLSGNTGRYEIILEKNGKIFSDDKEKINVSPDWTGMTGSYRIPYEAGKYKMKIFNIKEEKLVSTGDFEVVK